MGEGYSDDISHIRLGVCHGRCARVMVRGLEIRVLEGDNVWLISWICTWDSALVMMKFDGGVVLGGLWMVFLWVPCRGGTGVGKRKRQDTFSRVDSLDDTCF